MASALAGVGVLRRIRSLSVRRTPALRDLRNMATSSTRAPAPAKGGRMGPAGMLFFSSLCGTTFGLGAWQAGRYSEKKEMVRRREEDLELEPLPSFDDWLSSRDEAAGDGPDGGTARGGNCVKSYRRVALRGEFQHGEQMLVGPRGPPPGALAESGPNSGRGGGMSSSTQGYWVITPFVIRNEEEKFRDDGIQKYVGVAKEEEDAKPSRGWFGRLWGRPSSETAKSDVACHDLEMNSAREQPSGLELEKIVLWINRGWIPRHYIGKNNEVITPWEQPQGVVQLVAMESKTETPGTFTPPSRLDSVSSTCNNSGKTFVNKLLWLDRAAMEEMTPCAGSQHPPLFVEINDGKMHSLPAKPDRGSVGEFKVLPATHAGYAATWFGLSGAGVIMTRKLLMRGR